MMIHIANCDQPRLSITRHLTALLGFSHHNLPPNWKAPWADCLSASRNHGVLASAPRRCRAILSAPNRGIHVNIGSFASNLRASRLSREGWRAPAAAATAELCIRSRHSWRGSQLRFPSDDAQHSGHYELPCPSAPQSRAHLRGS